MRLIYLWIDSYQHIKSKGFLLDSGYDVQYDKECNELTVRRKENLDSLLYGPKISVTAIVGDNAAGKSTVLDAVRTVLFDQYSREDNFKGFLLYEDYGRLWVFNASRTMTKGCSSEEWEFTCSPDEGFNLIYHSDILDIKYYSDKFDDGENQEKYDYEERYCRNRESVQVNMSTSYLIRECDDQMLDYFHKDIRRQIELYKDGQGSRLPVSLPKKLSVKMDFMDLKSFDKVLDSLLGTESPVDAKRFKDVTAKAYIIDLLKEMERYYQQQKFGSGSISEIELLQWNILVVYLYNLFSMRQSYFFQFEDYSAVDAELELLIPLKNEKVDFAKRLGRLFSQQSTQSQSFAVYLKFYHEFFAFLEGSGKGNFDISFECPSIIEPFFRPVFHTDISRFLKFYDSYIVIATDLDFLKFSWGMSSGELKLFNLFARIHDALKRYGRDKIILLLDELDSSFHPKWQQNIIRDLTTFLREGYPEKEFQILFTTHSPVVLSDVPQENVIFLEKDSVVRVKPKETFAANIASLYYDSFFMQQGSIGSVARETIGNLLDTIDELEAERKIEDQPTTPQQGRGRILLGRFLSRQYSDQIKDTLSNRTEEQAVRIIENLISHIGEDIWRYKMKERFRYYLGKESEEQIEIQNRVERLKHQIGEEAVKEFLQQFLEEENK